MITITIATMLAAASIDTSLSAERSALSKCLKDSYEKAKSAKVEAGAFEAYMRTQCAAPEGKLRDAVIAIDVKNGISRKDAREGAQMDVDDYYLSTAERYEVEFGPIEEAEAPPAPAPAPVQAEAVQAAAPQPQE